MSAAPSPVEGTDRLLMFLFEDVRYAMPIAWVVEVAEKDRVTSVPSLALPVGGVMNWHGEALPLVATELLLGRERHEAGATPFGAAITVGYAQEQVLVLAAKPGSQARLGMPVDRVIGLIDGEGFVASRSSGGRLVVERRPVDGRLVHILDPATVVARGAEVIESATA
ncbi:MAG: chemotaxis protein CheW [Spirochaetaceae bacterium]|nr:chemotaxis protein CheW [Myxococcales bacterium]MCB9725811.1 chemotaxis protein CheW [Spirochaetaceae bacterium]HPG24186.1 chemotaxis protein CheW [Myxococcota bacterium]